MTITPCSPDKFTGMYKVPQAYFHKFVLTPDNFLIYRLSFGDF